MLFTSWLLTLVLPAIDRVLPPDGQVTDEARPWNSAKPEVSDALWDRWRISSLICCDQEIIIFSRWFSRLVPLCYTDTTPRRHRPTTERNAEVSTAKMATAASWNAKMKKKHIKAVQPKLRVFRAKEPLMSVFMWGINHSVSQFCVRIVDILACNMAVWVRQTIRFLIYHVF